MKITKKEITSLLYRGSVFLFGGLLLLFYLVNFVGVSDDFLPNFGKIASLVFIIVGITDLINYGKYLQDKEVEFIIENNILKYNGQIYPLKEAFLTLQSTQKKDFFRISLWIERKEQLKQIFENVVFDTDEVVEFLKIIKPYRKTNVCLLESSERVKLFENGLIFENREILYDEIEKFETKRIEINSREYLDIVIVLKNGYKIEKRLDGGIKEYAKVIYAGMKFDASGLFFEECKSYFPPAVGWIIGIIDVVVVLQLLLGYGLFSSVAVVMFIITILYLAFNTNDSVELCKEIQKLHQQDESFQMYNEAKDFSEKEIEKFYKNSL